MSMRILKLSGLIAVVLAASVICTVAAEAKPRGPDRTYGNSGFAHVPFPSRKLVDEMDCAADARGNVFVLSTPSWRKRSVLISKLNARGKLVKSFGTRGVLRAKNRFDDLTLVPDSKGRLMLLTSTADSQAGTRSWSLQRLTASGKPDKSFADASKLTYAVAGYKNFSASVIALQSGRIAVLEQSVQADQTAQSELKIYNTDGQPDSAFDTDSTKLLSFNGNSVGELPDGRVLVSGTGVATDPAAPATQNAVVANMLLPTGADDTSWGSAGFFRTSQLPARVWESYDSNIPAAPQPAATTHSSASAVAGSNGSATINVYTNIPSEEDSRVVGWGFRLTPGGTPDLTFGSSGTAYVANLDVDAALEADHDEVVVSMLQLGDGRSAEALHLFPAEQDNNAQPEVWGKVWSKSGKRGGSGVVAWRIPRFRGRSAIASSTGNFIFECGQRRWDLGPTVVRIRPRN